VPSRTPGRVSTEVQSESGLGLKAQSHACSVRAAKEERGLLGPSAGERVRGAAGLDTRPARVPTRAVAGPGDGQPFAERDRLGRYPVVMAMIRATVAR